MIRPLYRKIGKENEGRKKIRRICKRIVKNKDKVNEEINYYISNSKVSAKNYLLCLRKLNRLNLKFNNKIKEKASEN